MTIVTTCPPPGSRQQPRSVAPFIERDDDRRPVAQPQVQAKDRVHDGPQVGVALVESLLRSCPEMQIVTTSREPLGISFELTWRVPSLSLPGLHLPVTPTKVAQYEAVRLFVDRARAAMPSFALSNETSPHLARVCRALDGIRLALELAAPRVRVLTLKQVADRLDKTLHFLPAGSRTAPLRQQTLRATLGWSYQLLAALEQSLFDRLSIFVDRCTFEAVEAVGVGHEIEQIALLDLLAGLVDKTLVIAEPGEDGRCATAC
jgi:predicted ATPase